MEGEMVQRLIVVCPLFMPNRHAWPGIGHGPPSIWVAVSLFHDMEGEPVRLSWNGSQILKSLRVDCLEMVQKEWLGCNSQIFPCRNTSLWRRLETRTVPKTMQGRGLPTTQIFRWKSAPIHYRVNSFDLMGFTTDVVGSLACQGEQATAAVVVQQV